MSDGSESSDIPDTAGTGPQATSPAPSGPEPAAKGPYRVLARKYRPASFDALIGQDALVRTLTNAVNSGRLAQAWMLTGVRGVGKTTTARLIARALNCIGPDGTGGVTISPCGVCEHCRAIAEDRHVDVLEMDAASRTGVGDIREILDGVRYRPGSARTKVYIIDEVHMLSTAAFNALLKTLEEPPEHVKFIFATTEIRKVPVTVLSRCQRFDLRRVDADTLSAHFARIATQEGSTVEPGALSLIARAADGSVRDGLSLLDQAIAHGGSATVSEAQVAEMLGLADRAAVFDLLDAILRGATGEALDRLSQQYALGADPLVVLQDMLELVHWMTRAKVVPESVGDAAVPEAERTRGKEMAGKLSMPVLGRAWQILLKGLGEARNAPVPLQAVEMVLVRLAFAADLPTPEEALRQMGDGGGRPSGGGGGGGGAAPGGSAAPGTSGAASQGSTPAGGGGDPGGARAMAPRLVAVSSVSGGAMAATARLADPSAAPSSEPSPQVSPQATPDAPPAPREPAPWEDAAPPAPSSAPSSPHRRSVLAGSPSPSLAPSGGEGVSVPASFSQLVTMVRNKREVRLARALYNDVQLVRYAPQEAQLEIHMLPSAPGNLAGQLGKRLSEWTGQRWFVSVSDRPGQPTLRESTEADIHAHPLVQAVLDAFPKAKLGVVRETAPFEAADPPLPDPPDVLGVDEADDIFDPFSGDSDL